MNDRFNKTDYIRLIDRVLDAYTDEHIRAYTESVREGGIKEHGYPRLTANLGIVIAHGYRRGYTETFRRADLNLAHSWASAPLTALVLHILS